MLSFSFDLKKQYRVVIYVRMSSDKQNPRSPDQQIATINELMVRLGLNWVVVGIYRDDAISGRYSRKRTEYRRMLRDVKSGRVDAQLILVDTFERLSRARDAAVERHKLENAGVLVLTADTQFADPTTGAGQAMASFEALRSQQEGAIKGHNVLRGKRDAVRRKQWAGGPVPMGYRLKNVMATINGLEAIDHRVIEPDHESRFVVEEVFRLADENGWGGIRIAKHLNSDERLPEKFKPLNPTTVASWLGNSIYVGRFDWGKNCTGIVDDVRILQAVPEDQWERIEDYCEPLISREVWNRVQAVRDRRRRNSKGADGSVGSPCPCAPGVALKYPLSGLVRCSHCGRSMVANGSAAYVTQSGDSRRYTAYVCPGHIAGVCSNSRRIPEQWLRDTVFQLVRDRLLFGEA
jgi:DNA invertase Pin-like site-specific DNA recombinase